MKTFAEALALVPEFWPLVPGVDKWKEGDEILGAKNTHTGKPEYITVINSASGGFVKFGLRPRRPIPQSVRESEARWILYKALESKNPRAANYAFCLEELDATMVLLKYTLSIKEVHSEQPYCMPAFVTKDEAQEAVSLLGGRYSVIQMLTEGPGALWRWVEENRK